MGDVLEQQEGMWKSFLGVGGELEVGLEPGTSKPCSSKAVLVYLDLCHFLGRSFEAAAALSAKGKSFSMTHGSAAKAPHLRWIQSRQVSLSVLAQVRIAL